MKYHKDIRWYKVLILENKERLDEIQDERFPAAAGNQSYATLSA